MPIGFLTTTERERLKRFPAQIPDEDLASSSCYPTPIRPRSTNNARRIPLRFAMRSVPCAIWGLPGRP